MLFGKIFYMIHRTISVSFLRDTIRKFQIISKVHGLKCQIDGKKQAEKKMPHPGGRMEHGG